MRKCENCPFRTGSDDNLSVCWLKQSEQTYDSMRVFCIGQVIRIYFKNRTRFKNIGFIKIKKHFFTNLCSVSIKLKGKSSQSDLPLIRDYAGWIAKNLEY